MFVLPHKLVSVRQPLCTHWLVHKKIKEDWKKKNRELRKKIRPSLVENTISLKQIRLLHRCFENRKASVSQDKTIFEWQQQHSAATPANWKLFNSITDTEGTLTILQSFFLSVLMKESLPLFIDFKEGRIQTGSESQNEFGFLRLLEFWKIK